MNERMVGYIDKKLASAEEYVKRKDTRSARLLHALSSGKGREYRKSRQKRALDFSIACALAVPALATMPFIARRIHKEDGGSVFYKQDRYDEDMNLVPLRKYRTLHENSEPDGSTAEMAARVSADQDPRATRIGKFLRRHNLDELPQLWDVIRGRLSLIGIRANAPYAYEFMQERVERRRFSRWERGYTEAPPSLLTLNHVANDNTKNNVTRVPKDIYYAKHASLGMDCYIFAAYALKTMRQGLQSYPRQGEQVDDGVVLEVQTDTPQTM